MTVIRRPVVAGRFYPGDPASLGRELSRLIPSGMERVEALAVVSPHAGYIYSGHVAGAVFGQVEVPARVVVLGPNHTGLGARAAVMATGVWETPLGRIPVDEELSGLLLARSRVVEADVQAHAYEHSLEVQLPFIQAVRHDFSLLPICLQYLDYGECVEVGEALAETIAEVGGGVLMVASTDMTHYEPHETAKAKDALALARIEALDPKGLYDTVRDHSISMCGIIPTTIALVAARRLGATQARLVRYATSGEVSGDFDQVVGYAGFVIR